MKDANRLNVSHTIIIGDEEVENKQVVIKDIKVEIKIILNLIELNLILEINNNFKL